MKRRQIVDSRHSGAWRTADQAPVTGHVQHVNLLTPQPSRQYQLMPENIACCRPIFLRNRHQLHPAGRKREQWQIFLKHEQFEFVLVGMCQQGFDQCEYILRHAGLAALDDRR